MEQIEGGDLVVNKGFESKPRESDAPRNLNAVEGLETAFRLAEVIVFSTVAFRHSLTSL